MRPLRRPARELRAAIDAMPLATRAAMLEAIGRGPIVVGAYSTPGGGVCPMLAAHRNGGRTRYAEFARAWDRYARARKRPRPATARELRALRTMLEASIAGEDADVRGRGALARAIADHRRAQLARARREEHDIEPGAVEPGDAGPGAVEPPAAGPAYTPAPGRMSCSSGTMQAGEVLSR